LREQSTTNQPDRGSKALAVPTRCEFHWLSISILQASETILPRAAHGRFCKITKIRLLGVDEIRAMKRKGGLRSQSIGIRRRQKLIASDIDAARFGFGGPDREGSIFHAPRGTALTTTKPPIRPTNRPTGNHRPHEVFLFCPLLRTTTSATPPPNRAAPNGGYQFLGPTCSDPARRDHGVHFSSITAKPRLPVPSGRPAYPRAWRRRACFGGRNPTSP